MGLTVGTVAAQPAVGKDGPFFTRHYITIQFDA
jgi:hypothetical protein